MKKHLYFNKWWIPILTYLGIFGIYTLGFFLKRNWITDLSFILILLNFLTSLIITFASKEKWFFKILLFCLGIFALLYTFLLAYWTQDFYGANKKIPEDIEIFKPIDSKSIKYLDSNDGLKISGREGQYGYAIKYHFKEKGHLYIKAYEITSNKRLSEKHLNNKLWAIDTIEEKLYRGAFKIFEGSQYYEYGCRIELWLVPLDNKDEYKVTEQNFIITGWDSTW